MPHGERGIYPTAYPLQGPFSPETTITGGAIPVKSKGSGRSPFGPIALVLDPHAPVEGQAHHLAVASGPDLVGTRMPASPKSQLFAPDSLEAPWLSEVEQWFGRSS